MLRESIQPRSVIDLEGCARDHLRDYCRVGGQYAWVVYDWQGILDEITPTDVLAPALLEAPIRADLVAKMFRPGPNNPYRDLLDARNSVVQDTACRSTYFADCVVEPPDPVWNRFLATMAACSLTDGIKATMVVKILHRKLPDLVPLYDRHVRAFYGLERDNPAEFWSGIHADVKGHGAWLDAMRAPYTTPDGRPMSRLRALDIVVWMHEETRCLKS